MMMRCDRHADTPPLFFRLPHTAGLGFRSFSTEHELLATPLEKDRKETSEKMRAATGCLCCSSSYADRARGFTTSYHHAV